MQLYFTFILTISLNYAMAQTNPNQKDDHFLDSLLSNNVLFKEVMENKDAHRIQIIYTQINRDAKNNPHFKTFAFNLNKDLYFYPASTAKMPTAILALQKINELHIKGLDKNTAMLTDSAWESQSHVINDYTSEDSLPSIAHYIKKVFMVSDNDANNRLYEFLGQEYINNSLQKSGYTDAQILHRLGVSFSDEANRHTNPIKFVNKNNKVIYEQPAVENKLAYKKRTNYIGKGFYANNKLVNEPFNFSLKNNLPLADLNDMLLRVIFPTSFPVKKRFNLNKEDYAFLYKYMSQLPRESTYPSYDTTEKYDAYCKFLIYGSSKNIAIPKNIRIFNKIGVAYGFITDIAYIVDFENNIEFALSATIHVNKDGIFNDDKYEYETIGWPFMKNLGQVLYDFEKTRARKFKPDLNKFKIKYDK